MCSIRQLQRIHNACIMQYAQPVWVRVYILCWICTTLTHQSGAANDERFHPDLPPLPTHYILSIRLHRCSRGALKYASVQYIYTVRYCIIYNIYIYIGNICRVGSDHFIYTYHTPNARGVPDYYGIVVFPNKTCLRKYFYLENLATKTFWARRTRYENALFPLSRVIT